MAAVFKKRTATGKLMRRAVVIFLLILFFVNLGDIGRFFYPFPYRETTFQYARRFGVDPFLIAAVIKGESNFNKYAVSDRGARGLMQIMPETGGWVAGQLGDTAFNPDQLFDPETNIKYGSWYIADLAEEFHGDPVLVLAAYNGGRSNVKEWLANRELTGGESTVEQIPFPETRHFVKKVLKYRYIYRLLYSQGR
ncbi:MAG TPA: lytic transglycosylase domain-containing protein [Bacillota bacterium]|nr:lytic transglycosylase domain-containing protein [Bacillota bacterium]